MGIGNLLLDASYTPQQKEDYTPHGAYFKKIIKCPVSFTDDPIEYATDFIKYRLKPIQKRLLEDLFANNDANGKPKYTEAVFIAGMRCLAVGTLVRMWDNSLKKIEDIKVGEYVLGISEKRQVLTVDSGVSEMFKIHQNHAKDYVVNINHTLSLINDETGKVSNIPLLYYLEKSDDWKKKFKGYTRDGKLSTITVESIGTGNYAGIEIDGDHLFCLEDYTVTCNSGKSVIGGLTGSFILHKMLAMDNPATELGQAPGQVFTGEYIATSEEQSKQTAFSACYSIINYTPWWEKYLAYLQERELSEGKETLFSQQQRKIFFVDKRLEVVSLHSNSASLAGRTSFFVCFDEISRLDVSDANIQHQSEKRTAQAVYFTAARSAKTLMPFSRIITITSPMYEDDFGMQLLYKAGTLHAGSSKGIIETIRARYPDRVESVVGYHYSTFEANPKTEEDPYGYTEDDFKMEKQQSPEAFSRDFLAIPPSAVSPFFELPDRLEKSIYAGREPSVVFQDEILEESVVRDGMNITRRYIGKKVYPTRSDRVRKYFLCCDQGEVKDSFAIAMGHAEEVDSVFVDSSGKQVKEKRSKVIVDFVEAWIPDKENKITVSFQNVEDAIKLLNRSFHISAVVFDQWNSTDSIQRLFSEGVYTEKLGATIDMYETMKILFYSGMIEIPKNEKLLRELRQLNNIKNKRVDHPPNGGSKDLADAVVRAVWKVYTDSIRDAVHGNIMLPSGQRFPTIRSIATANDIIRNQNVNNANPFPHYGVFGSGASGGVFGKETYVQPNVMPNIGGHKF